MTDSTELSESQRRTIALVKAYPLGPLLIGIVLNLFVFGVDPSAVALPSTDCILALIIAAVLLAMNHTWIMTSTELTRVRFEMFEFEPANIDASSMSSP